MGVGASTWASGSQVCSGTPGTLIRNPINSSRNAHHWMDLPQSSSWSKGESSRGLVFSICPMPSSCPILARAMRLNVCIGPCGAQCSERSSLWTWHSSSCLSLSVRRSLAK